MKTQNITAAADNSNNAVFYTAPAVYASPTQYVESASDIELLQALDNALADAFLGVEKFNALAKRVLERFVHGSGAAILMYKLEQLSKFAGVTNFGATLRYILGDAVQFVKKTSSYKIPKNQVATAKFNLSQFRRLRMTFTDAALNAAHMTKKTAPSPDREPSLAELSEQLLKYAGKKFHKHEKFLTALQAFISTYHE